MRSAWFGQSEAVSASTFLYWQQHNQVFEAIAAFDLLGTGFSLSSGGEPEHVFRLRVSADYLRVLGATPALGRSFTVEVTLVLMLSGRLIICWLNYSD